MPREYTQDCDTPHSPSNDISAEPQNPFARPSGGLYEIPRASWNGAASDESTTVQNRVQ